MNEMTRLPFSPRVVGGCVLIALGVLFTLDSFGVIDAGSLGDYWPLFLMVPGFVSFAWPRKPADRFWGATVFAVGALLLMRNLGIIWISFRHIWPVVLVALGVSLVWRALDARRPPPGGAGGVGDAFAQRGPGGAMAGLAATREPRDPASAIDRLDEFAVFGGGDRMIRSQQFQGGHVTAIMGGFDIDLRDAVMAGDSIRIECFVMMGGIDLKVPESWTVVLDVMPFMGGANYRPRGQRAAAEGPQKILTVSGFAFMGGIDVKH